MYWLASERRCCEGGRVAEANLLAVVKRVNTREVLINGPCYSTRPRQVTSSLHVTQTILTTKLAIHPTNLIVHELVNL